MIVGVGVDLLGVARMERELARDRPGFVGQLFSAGEAAWCDARPRPALHYAAGFAAKEAVFKALALEHAGTGAFREVEIEPRGDGPPRVVLHGAVRRLAESRGVRSISLSVAYTRGLAAATVILES